jgi:hypothetical protein
VGVVFGEGPAGGADVDVVECGRVGRDRFHGRLRVGVWWIRRILLRTATGSEAPWTLGP